MRLMDQEMTEWSGPDQLRPIIKCQCTFRGLHEVCVYDLKGAYNSVYTTPGQKHVRRLVWRRSVLDPWEVYAVDRMHFGDWPSTCGLEEGKGLTAEAGKHVCPESASQVTLGYVDDNAGGGTRELVDRMIEEDAVEIHISKFPRKCSGCRWVG